ncbi:MAG: 50S ribosomal protein L25 [Balneolaceae bacterium]
MTQPELYNLEGTKRELGRNESEKLRDELRIPAVLYGPKVKENVHFSVLESDLEKILSVNETKLQTLEVDGKEYKTMLKNVEFDPVSDRALHADFYVLDPKKPVTLKVPIKLNGIAKGVRDGGGRVFQPMRIVRIRVVPDKIPAQFEVDITPMEIGDSIHVSELEMEGILPLDDPSRTIVTIAPPKSEELFTSDIEPDEDELLEGEEAIEGEELEEGEEPAEGEGEEEETKE